MILVEVANKKVKYGILDLMLVDSGDSLALSVDIRS